MPKMDDKEQFQLSGTNVFRRREPTNPLTAKHFTQMVFDHSKQMHVIPDSPSSHHTQGATRNEHGLRSTNMSGEAAHAVQAMVGGAPDYKGAVFAPSKSDTSPPPNGGRQGGAGETQFGTMRRRRS